jgi:glycosyltransferase involved in cell wall biosynthesis
MIESKQLGAIEQKQKILILLHSLYGGGAEMAMVNLVKNQGTDYIFLRIGIFWTENPNYKSIEQSLDVTLNSKKSRNVFSVLYSGFKLRQLIKRNLPSQIIVNCEAAETMYALFAPKSNAIIVHHVSKEGYWPKHKKLGRIIKIILERRKVKRAYVSKSLQNMYTPGAGVVLENVYNYDRIAPMNSVPQAGEPRLLFIGRLHPQKNPQLVLNLAKDLEVKALFFGSGPLRCILEESAQDLKLNCEFMGNRLNPWLHLTKSDILVLPSKYEGKPLVINEAVYFGLNVVSSNLNYLTMEYHDFPVFFAESVPDYLEIIRNLIQVGGREWSEIEQTRKKLLHIDKINSKNWSQFLSEVTKQ